MHGLNLHRRLVLSTLARRLSIACFAPQRPSEVAVYASGTDLESGNPLVTVHPLSRQIQRFALFVTLARYDADLAPTPYAATRWDWSADHRALTLHLVSDLRWHDDSLTTARDVAFTIDAARDPHTGYWRAADLADVDSVIAPRRLDRRSVFPHAAAVVSTRALRAPDSPVASARLHAARRHASRAVQPRAGRQRSVPFRRAPRRVSAGSFGATIDFHRALGGPPRLAAFVVSVVDEPTTKFAGLASGELDVAGIAPTMAALAARDRSLRVVDYPILFTTGLVVQQREAAVRRRARASRHLAVDRSSADRRRGARGLRQAGGRPGAAGESALARRATAAERRTSPIRCSTRRVGRAPTAACDAATVSRSASTCSPSAAATMRSSSWCRPISRRAASRVEIRAGRARNVPDRGARDAQNASTCSSPAFRATSRSRFSRRCSRRRQAGGALDYAGFHDTASRLALRADANARRATARASTHGAPCSATLARECPWRGSTTPAAFRASRRACTTSRWICAARWRR